MLEGVCVVWIYILNSQVFYEDVKSGALYLQT